MAIIASDNFNRANNPATPGTATTGQVWANVPGEGHAGNGQPFGILSNQAYWNRDGSGTAGDGLVALETGVGNAIVSVKLMDVLAGGISNLRNMGILFRYVDATHYIFATYARAGGGLWRLYVADGSSTPLHVGPDSAAAPVNGDTLSVEFCDQEVTIKLNGVAAEGYPFTFFPALSPTLLAGSKCGLQANGGVISVAPFQTFEDFLVETNAVCPGVVTYNCTGGACVDPGDGTGTYATLEACLIGCGVDESYNCVDGVCVDPGDGSGDFPTLLECELSGCTPRVAETMRFDAGNGSSYYVVPQITDSGDELRSKTLKSIRTTGIRTNVSGMVYGFDVNQEISTEDLETGTRTNTRMTTRPQDFSDSEGVTQSERKQINVANAVLSTVRIEGSDVGNEQRDRIDEIVIEQAKQGVRR